MDERPTPVKEIAAKAFDPARKHNPAVLFAAENDGGWAYEYAATDMPSTKPTKEAPKGKVKDEGIVGRDGINF